MPNLSLYILIFILGAFMAAAYFYRRPRRIRPAYHALLRDDLYFYPPRFPIPRPALRHHEVPHRKHFKKLN